MHRAAVRRSSWFWVMGIACLAALIGSGRGHATDWPQFLGPNRDGVSSETGLNWDWTASPPKVLWKEPLGSGYGSLAIVGERIYTMTKRGDRDFVVCLNVKDGKERWAYDAAPTYVDKQRQGAGPRSTPVFHDGKLYCLFPMGELICLTADGKRVWEVNTFKETGAVNPAGAYFYWGVSYSPLVEGDLVVVQPGGDKGNLRPPPSTRTPANEALDGGRRPRRLRLTDCHHRRRQAAVSFARPVVRCWA